ncbi:MAG TPA: NADH-quinone oxidoreductase subunit NuoH [Candidatus Kapabacteria bacterium]|nr:NADH-quinone oxidoreductase subunit NuoH [Candidatus Kapabacteria bacterium]
MISLIGKGDLSDVLAIVVYSALPLVVILLYALLAILAEMKVSAWLQDRLGPMRTGPWGVLQPLADILKLLQKEDLTPTNADRKLYNLAPYVVFIGSYLAFAALPFSAAYIGARINVGVFYIVAVSGLVVVGILMAGWGSNNKYSLFGSMRSVAQIVSYEIPSGLAILAVVMAAGSMDLQTISKLQEGGIQNWFIFGGPKHLAGFGGNTSWLLAPLMIIACIIYIVASLAETNRVPFDIPEAESELVAGYHTEYSAMKFALFFLAEYANMFTVSAVAAVLFFGGWNSPFGDLLGGPVTGFLWFVAKALFFVFIQIWIRWTLPRLRVDQLMNICWKVMIPFGMATVLVVGTLITWFIH